MLRFLFRAVALYGLWKASTRGPGDVAKREARRRAHRAVHKVFR